MLEFKLNQFNHNFCNPYFPTGCYTLCSELLPVTLNGPPDVSWALWAWLMNGSWAEYGFNSVMSPYSLTGAGDYQWQLSNGLCFQTSDTLALSIDTCDQCQQFKPFVVQRLVCDSSNPASYKVVLILFSPVSGTSYTLGTNIGPLTPFSGTLPAGSTTMTLTFTTLGIPPPDSVTIEIIFTSPKGGKCVQKETLALPSCGWIAEKNGHAGDSTDGQTMEALSATSMLVFPNPASNVVTISYDYGTNIYGTRNLTVYDAMGRKMDYTMPQDQHGSWNLSTQNWASGIYIIRMEGEGQALQTQRMVVVH